MGLEGKDKERLEWEINNCYNWINHLENELEGLRSELDQEQNQMINVAYDNSVINANLDSNKAKELHVKIQWRVDWVKTAQSQILERQQKIIELENQNQRG